MYKTYKASIFVHLRDQEGQDHSVIMTTFIDCTLICYFSSVFLITRLHCVGRLHGALLCLYLSHCYTIAWDRLSNQFFCLCMYVCMYVCVSVSYGRIFQPIFTKFGKNLWGLNRKN